MTAQLERGGRFTFTTLSAEGHTIRCASPPKGWALSPCGEVTAGTQCLELLLRPTVLVEGRVLDRDGTPVQALVWANQGGDRMGMRAVSTDESGRFGIEVPAEFHGSLGAVHVADPDQTASCDRIVAGQRGIELRLGPR